MKTITFPILSTDFIDELVKRDGDVILNTRCNRKSGRRICYEVQIVRKYRKTVTFHNTTFHEGDEFLSGPAAWGQYGWSFSSIQQAEEKFQAIVSRQKTRETSV